MLMRKINRSILMLMMCVCLGTNTFGQTATGIWNVVDYGAKGDGTTLDTKAIQAAIDACHDAGGGRVYLQNGQFVSGTIILKDNVTLEVEAGAVLRASRNLDDFPIMPSKYPSYEGEMVTNKMLIYAEDATRISIIGRGTIDGGGDYWVAGPYQKPSFSGRPRIIHFRGCENVQVRDVTLYNSASWVQSYQSCRNMVISGITVDSRENKDINKERYADVRGRNTDGLDLVDCNFVRISDCLINSGDDAICLKSFSPDESCSNITITNCVVSANASGIKIGTETAGTMEDIVISNCVVFDTRGAGIALMTADGAQVRRVSVTDISMRNIKGGGIFVRLGTRLRPYRKGVTINTPALEDIHITNVQGTGIFGAYGCSITGVPGMPVKNVALKNINLTFDGGGTAEDAERVIPENEKNYPAGTMFGTLPAYGFFIRHVKNIQMDDVTLRVIQQDHRPAVVADDVSNFDLTGLEADGSPESAAMIRLVNANEVLLAENNPRSSVPVFAEITGSHSQGIRLLNNRLQNAGNVYAVKNGADESQIKVSTNF